MKSKIPVSDLLAHRDGEHVAPKLAAEIETDADSRADLKVLREIKHALNELPDIDPGDAIWRNIDARLKRAQPLVRSETTTRLQTRLETRLQGLSGRFPWANVATAATVFFAAALTILWWNPGNDGRGDLPNASLSDVVLRSQQLESRIFYPAGTRLSARQVARNPSQQALLYRIADVDSELNSEGVNQLEDPLARERLWRQRVALLESLMEVQRSREPAVRTALY